MNPSILPILEKSARSISVGNPGCEHWARPGALRAELAGGQAHRDQVRAAPFEHDLRQRPGRRPLQHRPVGDRERASVAWAIEAVGGGIVENRARRVSTETAVGDIRFRGRPQQDARLGVGRVGKNFRSPDRNFPRLCHDARGKTAGESRSQKHRQSRCKRK